MQIVIDIPETLYNNLKNGCGIYPYRLVYNALINGTPLPEGHGRLIDEDKITKCEQIGLIIKDGNITRCLKTDAPTIIGADKMESEVSE